MMREKIHSYLGFARKSRSLVSGYNSCVHEIQRGRVGLILLTEDLKQGTKDTFEELAASKNIPLCYYGTMEKMAEMTGVKGRGVFAITDKNLATAIENEVLKAENEEVCNQEKGYEKSDEK